MRGTVLRPVSQLLFPSGAQRSDGFVGASVLASTKRNEGYLPETERLRAQSQALSSPGAGTQAGLGSECMSGRMKE